MTKEQIQKQIAVIKTTGAEIRKSEASIQQFLTKAGIETVPAIKTTKESKK